MRYTVIMTDSKSALSVFFLIFFGVLLLILSYFWWESFPENAKRVLGSPDETSAQYFIEHFARQGYFFAPKNEAPLPDFVHPRSTSMRFGHIVPGGFLGELILYGLVRRIFFIPIFLITPAVVVVASLAFFFFLRNIGFQKEAFFSSLFFLFHPAILYYTIRGLFPNVLFVSLLIFSCWSFSNFLRNGRNTFMLFGSFLAGIAISVRPVEVIWVSILVILFFLFNKKKISLQIFFLSIFYFFLALAPLLYHNYETYGNVLASGYAFGNDGIFPKSFEGKSEMKISLISSIIFPFGFEPKIIFSHIWNYLILLFAPFSLLSFLGLYFIFREKKWYFISFLVVFFSLIFFYGSWTLQDNIEGEITLGVSQVRYWLPLFVFFILPLVRIFYLWREKIALPFRKIFSMTFFLSFFLFSFAHVFLIGNEALANPKKDRFLYSKIFAETQKLVLPNAIILSERSDKIFFPEFQVIDVTNNREFIFQRLKELENIELLYYFSIYPPSTLLTWNKEYFLEQGFSFELLKIFQGRYYMYRAIKK